MTDLVTNVARIPRGGETMEALGFSIGQGGKGANQAVAAARLGSDVLMVAKLGDDPFGRNTVERLAAAGVDARHVGIVPSVASGVATILVEPDGENRIMIAKGANDCLLPEDIDKAKDDLLACDLILLQLEIPLPTVYYAIAFAATHGKQVLLNPAPAMPALEIDRIRDVAFFFPNQTELQLLTGRPAETREDAERAARLLIARGIERVVVTLGSQGALLVTATEAVHVPSIPVEVRDTTGAGDACIGCFAHYYTQTGDAPMALQFATRYAASAITRPGAQDSFANMVEFQSFLNR